MTDLFLFLFVFRYHLRTKHNTHRGVNGSRFDKHKVLLGFTLDAFATENVKTAARVEPLEEVIDDLVKEIKQRHIDRLRSGNCSMEAGLLLEDILTNYERVSDHCSNVAITLIAIPEDALDMHQYLDVTVKGYDPHFLQEYHKLKQIYMLS